MSTWTEIDEPVLRWLRGKGSSFLPEVWILELGLRNGVEPSQEIDGLSTEQEHEALVRLQGHGLIEGRCQEAIGFSTWSRLRVTARGLQVLGEWPDLDQLASAVGLKLLLNELASRAADSDDQSALRRLVGIVGEVGEGVAIGLINHEAAELGDGAVD